MPVLCYGCERFAIITPLKRRDNKTRSPHLNPTRTRNRSSNPFRASLRKKTLLKCPFVLPRFWPVLEISSIAPLGQRLCAWGFSELLYFMIVFISCDLWPLISFLSSPTGNNYANYITLGAGVSWGSTCPSLCAFVQELCLQHCHYYTLFMSCSLLSDSVTQLHTQFRQQGSFNQHYTIRDIDSSVKLSSTDFCVR